MQKRKLFNILRIVCYCLGFPLLFLIGLIASMPFFGEPVYADACANGILILLGMWAIVEIVRFSMKFALRKSRLLQTIVTVAVAIIVMAVPMFVMDAVLSKQYGEIVNDSANIAVSFENGSKLKVEGEAEVTLSDKLEVPTEFFNAGFETENYEYQVGWFKGVTNTKRRDGMLYYQLISETDAFMNKTGINKWLNFKDYKFNNYEEDTGDGLALGVASMLEKDINTSREIIALYYYQTEVLHATPSSELTVRYYVVTGNTYNLEGKIKELVTAEGYNPESTVEGLKKVNDLKAVAESVSKSNMSINDLYELKLHLETRPSLYPVLAVRNYIYIFIGIVAFMYVLIYMLNEKRLATPEDEMITCCLKKLRKSDEKAENKKGGTENE
ncbi:MAG: hypothetical protein ACI4QU_00150 [Christensenellales bacterium]